MDALIATGIGAPAPKVEKGFGTLDSDQFTKLILTELSNQDPLEPNDTGDLLEQLSTIRSIESDTKLNSTLESMATRTEFSSAAALIGKKVSTAQDPLTQLTVTSVLQNSDGVSVALENGTTVAIRSISSVFGADDKPGGAE